MSCSLVSLLFALFPFVLVLSKSSSVVGVASLRVQLVYPFHGRADTFGLDISGLVVFPDGRTLPTTVSTSTYVACSESHFNLCCTTFCDA